MAVHSSALKYFYHSHLVWRRHAPATVNLWRSEDNVRKSLFFSFQQTRVSGWAILPVPASSKATCFHGFWLEETLKISVNYNSKIYPTNSQISESNVFWKQVGEFSIIPVSHWTPLTHMEHITRGYIGLEALCCASSFVCVVIDIPLL